MNINSQLNPAAMAERFDNLISRKGLPDDWPALWKETGLFLMDHLRPVDHDMIKELKLGYDKARQGERGYSRADPKFLAWLEAGLSMLEADLLDNEQPLHPELLRGQIEDLLDRVTARMGHGYIWFDAFAIGVANCLGYIAGTAMQTWIERLFCEARDELWYDKRMVAELANRTVQHAVRFLIRDVAIPAIRAHCGIKKLEVPQEKNCGSL